MFVHGGLQFRKDVLRVTFSELSNNVDRYELCNDLLRCGLTVLLNQFASIVASYPEALTSGNEKDFKNFLLTSTS